MEIKKICPIMTRKGDVYSCTSECAWYNGELKGCNVIGQAMEAKSIRAELKELKENLVK